MEDFWRDLEHSVRMFLKAPGFTLTAIAALMLGIGANTAVFSVVNTVLLRPAPFPDPDRLVVFMNTSPQGSGSNASPVKFNLWRRQTSAFQDVAAFRAGVANLTGGENPEQIAVGQVSADFFKLFGAPMANSPVRYVVQQRTLFPWDLNIPNTDDWQIGGYGNFDEFYGGDDVIVAAEGVDTLDARGAVTIPRSR